ncbi:MAG: META domain-containing protein [Marinobacter sp.]|uniref:META domain-containing protein n=1 Tax=Marinobacter sp. TaxID=50741 RepID=UPI00299F09FF|nr:META domain-containing protein [Marinobacter sp.]MDX1756417.1 META domain-containing protein [Marinobacter sp.]
MKAVLAGISLIGGLGLAGCSGLPNEPVSGEISTVTAMECGQLDVQLVPHEEGVLLQAGTEEYLLAPTRSASGARYALPVDPSTWFWSSGERALLETGGRRWPECVMAGGLTEPFSAQGNEPFWRVSVADDKLRVEELDGQALVADVRVVNKTSSGRTLVGDNTDQSVEVAVARQLCRDSMSGMPHPYQVRLTLNGDVRNGCGGDPALLLRGVEWTVEAIDGSAVLADSRVNLTFLADNRVAGKASCNNFMGGYELSGEGLAFSQTATTLMACAPALMQQEDRFLKLLAEVARFDFDARGKLVLQTADGRTLTAQSRQTLGR